MFVLILFAGACYCLEEETIYFSYQSFKIFFPDFTQKQSNLYRLTLFKEVYWKKLPQDGVLILH